MLFPYDKTTEPELIANVLGRKKVDKECFLMASMIMTDGNDLEMSLKQIALEGGPAAIKRTERVLSAIELGRRSVIRRQAKMDRRLFKPEQIVELMEPMYAGKDQEVFYCLCLNTKNYLKRLVEISVGTLNASIVHPRDLYRKAVEVSASSIIITHNHPSGDPTPSSADMALTRRLAKAGDILGIELLDHIVIGGGGRFTSFRDEGLL